MAPAWIVAADHDPLYDEDIAFASKLEEAGVPVTLMRYEGVIHEFFKMGGFVPEVADAHADAVSALRAAFDLMRSAFDLERKRPLEFPRPHDAMRAVVVAALFYLERQSMRRPIHAQGRRAAGPVLGRLD